MSPPLRRDPVRLGTVTVPAPSRVLVTALGEDRPRDRRELELLFRTLQHFGGGLASSRQVAYLVNSVDQRFARKLESIGVEPRVVPRVDVPVPHANKIRMLEGIEREVDWLVILDTDIVIGGDFTRYLGGPAVRARPVDHSPLDLDQWETLFARCGVRLPSERYYTSLHYEQTVPYFNSGVVALPGAVAPSLAALWIAFVRIVSSLCDTWPALREHRFYIDQLALALALAQLSLPVVPLPLEMNFPTHIPLDARTCPDEIEPLIIHHHHRISGRGLVAQSGYTVPDRVIARVNEYLCGSPA